MFLAFFIYFSFLKLLIDVFPQQFGCGIMTFELKHWLLTLQSSLRGEFQADGIRVRLELARSLGLL